MNDVPYAVAPDGGYQWPFYLGIYGNYTIWNYAVGGAVCSNELTPVNSIPTDVAGGQIAWFVEDHVERGKLLLQPSELEVVLWIGTNDFGALTRVASP